MLAEGKAMTWYEWGILTYLVLVCAMLGIGARQESQRVKRLREQLLADELDAAWRQ